MPDKEKQEECLSYQHNRDQVFQKIQRASAMRYLIIILLTAFLLPLDSYSQNEIPPLSKQIKISSKVELGKRYLKLGNTYREASNFKLAKKYLSKGIIIVETAGNQYWTAVGYEFIGYYYRDQNDIELAVESFTEAEDIYKKVITQKDGSPSAIALIIEELDPSYSEGNNSFPEEKSGNHDFYELKNAVDELNDKINQLQRDLSLRFQNKPLQSRFALD